MDQSQLEARTLFWTKVAAWAGAASLLLAVAKAFHLIDWLKGLMS